MQDRNAGDVGDFMKLGLLRWLTGPTPFAPRHHLGVVWFRVADETGDDSHGPDGAHWGYLDPASSAGQDLRPLDPALYDRLGAMVGSGNRSVASLVACGALPAGTRYFDCVLSFADLDASDQVGRTVRRERWFHEAMVAVDSCSLVFVDPDDGLRGDDHPFAPDRDLAEKHTHMSEVGRLLARGQSVVVHHDVDPSEPVQAQALSIMSGIRDALGVEPVAAVRTTRGVNRLFLVIPHDERHRAELDDRLGALQLCRWGDELRVYRWQRDRAFA